MQKSLLRKGIVVSIIVLFVIISINPITISRTNNYNTINEEQSFDILNPRNNPPIVNRTFPPDGAEDILVAGTPINTEIYDADDDDLWVEMWSNYTGEWIEYASYDVFMESERSILYNASSLILVDFDGDGEWNILDAILILGREGWGQSGNWGFMYNISVTNDWGMTKYGRTYYWSVNVTDNSTWTNETYHFSTKTVVVDVVYVDDDFNESTPGWGYDHFDSIQDGIDVVAENGTVYVFNGTYYENIIIAKKLNLVGENKDATIIDGSGVDKVVSIFVNGTNINKFTIQNGGGESGVYIWSNYNTISHNNIVNNSGSGIFLTHSSNNKIICNDIINNSNYGIYLSSSNSNTIENNNINGDYDGLSIWSSCNNIITGNSIRGSTCGISLKQESDVNIIYENAIKFNQKGIYIYDSNENTITGNNISENSEDGICLYSSSNNLIYNNYFDNMNNAWDNGINYWNTIKTLGTNIIGGPYLGGNYWSDYVGVDIDGDGLGDSLLPYHSSGYIQYAGDWLPLVHVQPNIPPTANFSWTHGGLMVFFSDESIDSDGTIESWYWDLGDGNTSTQQDDIHTYPSPDTYVVTLTVTDDDGASDNETKNVTIPIPDYVYVGYFDDCPPTWGYDYFGKIQDGIDAVAENGTVYVFNGTYYENITIGKTINLIGENKNQTIIDANGSGYVIYVSANSVNISGFTIRDGASIWDGNIAVHSNNNCIFGNIIVNNSGTLGSICLTGASNNNIFDNSIIDNHNDWGASIYIMSSSNMNNIYGNDIIGNSGQARGIEFFSASNNNIFGNIISNTKRGIFLDMDSTNINITGNTISDNWDYGIWICSSSNVIHHNNFFNNTQHAIDSGINIWDNGYPSGGNYWDDYTGADADDDGIGDIPYNISGGSNQDLYPLMYPGVKCHLLLISHMK